MKKTYLLTPGPTPIPENVISVFARPIVHHRTKQFEAIFDDVKQSLKYVFQTKQDVLVLNGTGTAAMDAAVSNIFKKGEKVITVNGGKFGDRWTKISKAYGLQPIELKVPAGEAVAIAEVESAVRQNPDAQGILWQASETSTGVCHPTRELSQIAKSAGMLSIVDGVTGVGVFDLPMDAWGIDIMLAGSQKAFMIPPGLSFIALSDKAWAKSESCDLPHFYLNLAKERKALADNQSAWTPAISLILGLQETLKMMREETLLNIFKRHDMLARATRAAVEALGLEPLCKKSPSPAVTAVKTPVGIESGEKIPKLMKDKYGVTITGGQDDLKGKIFRLSHFGYCSYFDITTGIACLELVLNELGYKVDYGKGVGAALRVFSESK